MDNITIKDSANADKIIATDEVTGTLEHVQRVKLAIAADGSQTAVPADGTDGLLVNLGTNNDVTVTGTVTANLAAGTNNIGDVDVLSLPAIPAGTNNIGDVDVVTINGVAPAFGSGARGASVQRVTIATDDSVPVTGTFWQDTQPVSGTVAAPAVNVYGGGNKTDTTDQSVMEAAASNYNYLCWVAIYNSSATNTYANIKDNTTVRAVIPLPAYGGAIVQFAHPLKAAAVNTAWNVAAGASVTTASFYGGGYQSTT